MNTSLEIIKVIQELKIRTSNNFELQNIKLLAEDIAIDENGQKYYKSNNTIQISYNDYIQRKLNEIIMYLKIQAHEALIENERAKKYLIKNYRKNDKALARILFS